MESLNFLFVVLAGLQEREAGAGLPEVAEAGAGLPEVAEAGVGLPEVVGAGAGLPEIVGAGAGLLEIGGAGAGLPLFDVQVDSVVRIKDERKHRCQTVLISFEAGATVEDPVDICTMVLERVMNQGGRGAKRRIWSFLMVLRLIFVKKSSGSRRKKLFMSMMELEA